MTSHRPVIAAAVMVVAAAAPANAWVGHAARATFLRAGPGLEYAVTDEVDRTAPVEVLKCDGAWCEVRFEGLVGWLQAAMVAAPAAPSAQPPGTQPCFDDRQAGYGKGERTRFCPR